MRGWRIPNRKNGARFILSYGGGVNSFALLLLLLKRRKKLDEVVFADTGAELPETYRHLRYARKVLKEKNIPFTEVSSKNGSLYDTCRRRKVIPSVFWRWSTRDYKITPIYSYYRSLGDHINQYLAICWDEIDRMKDSLIPSVTNLYPLIDGKLTRADCVKIIEEEGFPVPVKSGCYFCPFNSNSRWEYIYRNHRDFFTKARKLEETSKHFPKQRLSEFTLRQLGKRFRYGKHSELPQITLTNPCGAECIT
jgi:3'-phosphoadenosine 5'-phosphosulfate sulfotransferase (PAPS reductase)/FAD synthetase